MQTLTRQLRITEAEVRERKDLLGISHLDELEMIRQRDLVSQFVDELVLEFYEGQIATPKIRNIIGDADTLARLQKAMRIYILSLFEGEYTLDYVESRLRIGKVHSRIGVPPKLYVSSMLQLENLLFKYIKKLGEEPAPTEAITKFFLFDLQLVFDTYIQGLMAEVELGREELLEYAESLEQTILERTSKIEHLANSDDLTGLGNRRSFFKTMNLELSSAQRRSESLSLIFADVDGFKAINDEFGHLRGDQVLRTIASIISKISDCKGFRFRGDEFCIILPNTDLPNANKISEMIVKSVEGSGDFPISISIGISTAGPKDYPEIDVLVARADSSMYDKKNLLKPGGTVITIK